MMKEALISVIVPVYNVQNYVEKCLESIINQTYKNLEIIVVDDGSTDNSYTVCKKFVEMDSRIILLQKENGGLASARNFGLEHIHGKYVGFVDSDDWLENDTYECMLSAIESRENTVVICGRYNVDEQSLEKTPHFSSDNTAFWSNQTAIGNILTWENVDSAVCDKLFPTELISDLRFDGTLVSEDMEFTYKVLKKSEGAIHIGKPKYNYLQRTGSLSRAVKYHERLEGMRVHPKYISDDVKNSFPNLSKKADCFKFTNYIIYCNVLGKTKVSAGEALRELRKSFTTVLFNPYISGENKLICVLAVIGVLSILHKIKRALKRGGNK